MDLDTFKVPLELIDFDTFVKVLGGTIVVGLLPYFSRTLTHVGKLMDASVIIEKTRKTVHKIDNNKVSVSKFEKEIEGPLNSFVSIPIILNRILLWAQIAFYSIVIFTFFNDWYFPFNNQHLYFWLIIIPNNFVFYFVPCIIFYFIIRLYKINVNFLTASRIWQERYGNDRTETSEKK